MNRFFKLSVLCLFINLSVFAQIPKGINYQGVARLATGTPIAQKTISVRVSILQNSPTGTIEYSETHQPTTNEFGLFTLVIGQGTADTGNFEFISWANGNKWLEIEMDPEGASNYSLIGSQQLMSVPYSYYAQYAGNSLKAGPGLSIENNIISNTGDNDNNATNELNTNVVLGTDKILRITDAGGTKQADLSVLAGTVQNISQVLSQGTDAGAQRISNLGAPTNLTDAATKTYVDNHVDADASPTNEIQDLNLTGNNLTITNNTVATTINLAPYLDNTDNQNLTLNPLIGTSRTVNISNGSSVTFDVADNDNNATNEIQALTKTGGQISLSNGGGTVTLNDDSNTNEIQTLSKVGATISLTSGGSVALNDDSNSNEIQDLNRVGNTLSLTGDATTVDLSPYLDNTDGQTLVTQSVDANTRSVAITGGNTVNVDVRDADANATNELQDLTLAANTLSLSNDATTVNLTPYLDNTDNQNLSLATPIVGTNRTINISNGTNVTFDVADNDNNSTNEIQTLSKTGATIALTSGGSISLNDDSNTNEIQNLTYTPGTNSLVISGGNTQIITHTLGQVLTQSTDALTSKITNLGAPTLASDAATKQYVDNLDAADLDKSITNEIQNLTYTPGTNSLAISGGNTQTITHTLGQVLTQSNDALTSKITNLGAPTLASDATTKQYVDNLDAADLDKSISNEIQNLGNTISGTQRTITISGGTGTTIDVADNDNNSTNEIQNLGNTVSGTQRTITISGGTGTTIDVADNDNSATNELQTLNQVLANGATGNDAGGLRIQNLGSPTGASDATTKQYVDNADALLSSRISTTYSFKTAFSYTNTSGSVVNNQQLPFTIEEFDDFNVLASNSFTATENGVYVFMVDGTYLASAANGQLSLFYNSVKYPISIVLPLGSISTTRFNATLMFKLTAGQTVRLIGDSILDNAQFNGTFFGYKL